MMKEAARRGLDDHFLAVAADRQPVERLHRALRLAMRRSEGGEIVEADQLLRRGVHRIGVERPRDLPRQSLVPRQRRAAVDDAIFIGAADSREARVPVVGDDLARSEEHTSELQSLMRISYAVFCLKQKQSQ